MPVSTDILSSTHASTPSGSMSLDIKVPWLVRTSLDRSSTKFACVDQRKKRLYNAKALHTKSDVLIRNSSRKLCIIQLENSSGRKKWFQRFLTSVIRPDTRNARNSYMLKLQILPPPPSPPPLPPPPLLLELTLVWCQLPLPLGQMHAFQPANSSM